MALSSKYHTCTETDLMFNVHYLTNISVSSRNSRTHIQLSAQLMLSSCRIISTVLLCNELVKNNIGIITSTTATAAVELGMCISFLLTN